jgi:transposase
MASISSDPLPTSSSWQAQADQGYGTADFVIDWQAQTAYCPQGHQSWKFLPRKDRHDHDVIHIKFAIADCLSCPVRSLCTHSSNQPRTLMIRSEQSYVMLQKARQRQLTQEFKEQYNTRAGIEGTLSQGIRAFELRRSRYVGEDKTRLQHLMIGVALNVKRLFAWVQKSPPGKTRCSRFASLAPKVA